MPALSGTELWCCLLAVPVVSTWALGLAQDSRSRGLAPCSLGGLVLLSDPCFFPFNFLSWKFLVLQIKKHTQYTYVALYVILTQKPVCNEANADAAIFVKRERITHVKHWSHKANQETGLLSPCGKQPT